MASGRGEDAVSLSREQRHSRAVRRSLWGIVAAFTFGGVAFLGGYFDSRPLMWIANIGIVACLGYVFSNYVELFRVWFIRGKKR